MPAAVPFVTARVVGREADLTGGPGSLGAPLTVDPLQGPGGHPPRRQGRRGAHGRERLDDELGLHVGQLVWVQTEPHPAAMGLEEVPRYGGQGDPGGQVVARPPGQRGEDSRVVSGSFYRVGGAGEVGQCRVVGPRRRAEPNELRGST